MKLKRDRCRDIVEAVWGQITTVEFTKKDGSLRKMTGRIGVMKDVKGDEACESAQKALASWKANPENQKYVKFYDFSAKDGDGNKEPGWRTINLDTVSRIACGGAEYLFDS